MLILVFLVECNISMQCIFAISALFKALIKYLWYREVMLSKDSERRIPSSHFPELHITRLLGWGNFLPRLGQAVWVLWFQRAVFCSRNSQEIRNFLWKPPLLLQVLLGCICSNDSVFTGQLGYIGRQILLFLFFLYHLKYQAAFLLQYL